MKESEECILKLTPYFRSIESVLGVIYGCKSTRFTLECKQRWIKNWAMVGRGAGNFFDKFSFKGENYIFQLNPECHPFFMKLTLFWI